VLLDTLHQNSFVPPCTDTPIARVRAMIAEREPVAVVLGAIAGAKAKK
jgi:hypothetical protein